MPIYEYQCEACGAHLEKLQKMSDAPITTCPKCEKETLKKKISAAGFRLKGTGWYATDFKDKKSTEKKSKDNKSKDNKATEQS